MANGANMMVAYTIVERENADKAFWVRVGASFANRDGSINIYLDALPVNGRLQLREPDPGPEQKKEED
jgi:hypothetical protein